MARGAIGNLRGEQSILPHVAAVFRAQVPTRLSGLFESGTAAKCLPIHRFSPADCSPAFLTGTVIRRGGSLFHNVQTRRRCLIAVSVAKLIDAIGIGRLLAVGTKGAPYGRAAGKFEPIAAAIRFVQQERIVFGKFLARRTFGYIGRQGCRSNFVIVTIVSANVLGSVQPGTTAKCLPVEFVIPANGVPAFCVASVHCQCRCHYILARYGRRCRRSIVVVTAKLVGPKGVGRLSTSGAKGAAACHYPVGSVAINCDTLVRYTYELWV